MKRSTTLLLTTLAAPALLAAGAPFTTLSFAPDEGTTLTKKFTSDMELTMEDMSMSMNGEEMPFEMEMDMTVNTVQSMTVSDEYVKMRKGAPAQLKRAFDELLATTSISMEMVVPN